MIGKLTHVDERGAVHMIDISSKDETARQAIAQGRIAMSAQAVRTILDGAAKKGDVLAVARVAGIMAAKKTSNLIPLCHPLSLSAVTIEFELDEGGVTTTATVRTTGQTGVEMEAMTAVSVALLTIYDMVKSIDKKMIINEIHLVEKTGGKSGFWRADGV